MRRELLVGAALLALSIPLGLLGRSVLAAPAATARVDADVPADRGLADRAAARLLAAERAERFLAVVRAYRHAMEVPLLAANSTNPIRIAHTIPALHSPAERAQAHVMVGAIFALPAGEGDVSFDLLRRAGAARMLDQAAAEFRAAASADEANEEAKYDLELLLKQQLVWRQSRRAADDEEARRKSRQAKQKRRPRSPRIDLEQHHAGIYASGTGY